MHRYDTIIFDLDGTLMDPSNEILTAAEYALKQCEIQDPDKEMLQGFLARPLLRCFEEDFGLTRDQADQAFKFYWHYAGSVGLRQNVCYEGVPRMLHDLKDQGKDLHIATARETQQAIAFLKTKKLFDLFGIIMGPSASEIEGRQTKKIILFDVLCEMDEGISGENIQHDIVMVGDRNVDIFAAKDNGIDSIGVTYGQDTEEKIIESEPTHIVHNVEELAAILLNGEK